MLLRDSFKKMTTIHIKMDLVKSVLEHPKSREPMVSFCCLATCGYDGHCGFPLLSLATSLTILC